MTSAYKASPLQPLLAAQRDANAAATMQMELARQAIRDNPANAGNPGQIAALIFGIGPNPYVPMFLAPQAQCNAGLHNQIKIYEENVEKHQIAADKAMTIIQSNLGETMLEATNSRISSASTPSNLYTTP